MAVKIEDDRAFAAIVLPEKQRAIRVWPVLVERSDGTCRVAAWRLDLDDIGSSPRKRQAAIFRLLVRHLDDPNARERSRLCRRRAGHGVFWFRSQVHRHPSRQVSWRAWAAPTQR